jgi:hypothetical protein
VALDLDRAWLVKMEGKAAIAPTILRLEGEEKVGRKAPLVCGVKLLTYAFQRLERG